MSLIFRQTVRGPEITGPQAPLHLSTAESLAMPVSALLESSPVVDPSPPVNGGDVVSGGESQRDVAGTILTDEALALRLKAGDSASGEELVKRFHPSLSRYLHRLTGADHLAEELHQQTWLSVLSHISRFDPVSATGGFKAWLFRIATNKANDYWRSRGREKSATEGLRLVTDDAVPAADHRLENTEQEAKLKRAIAHASRIATTGITASILQ